MTLFNNGDKNFERYYCGSWFLFIFTDLTKFKIYIKNYICELSAGYHFTITDNEVDELKYNFNLYDFFENPSDKLNLKTIHEDLENILNKILSLKAFE
jgi:hypothetical protein